MKYWNTWTLLFLTLAFVLALTVDSTSLKKRLLIERSLGSALLDASSKIKQDQLYEYVFSEDQKTPKEEDGESVYEQVENIFTSTHEDFEVYGDRTGTLWLTTETGKNDARTLHAALHLELDNNIVIDKTTYRAIRIHQTGIGMNVNNPKYIRTTLLTSLPAFMKMYNLGKSKLSTVGSAITLNKVYQYNSYFNCATAAASTVKNLGLLTNQLKLRLICMMWKSQMKQHIDWDHFAAAMDQIDPDLSTKAVGIKKKALDECNHNTPVVTY